MTQQATAVLAHAVGFTGATLEPIAARLGNAVTFDLLGHGSASMDRGNGYSWAAAGRRLLADIEAAGIDGPRIGFGHSGGGVALLWAEVLAPGTFEALFLYEPPLKAAVKPDPSMPVPTLAETVARRRNSFPDAAAFEEYLRKRDPYRQFDEGALAGYIATGIVPDGTGGFQLACPPLLESDMYMSPDEGLVDRLRTVQVPVILAYGEQTFDRFITMTEAVLSHLPNSRAVAFPGLTHFGPLVDPEAVSDAFRRELLDNLSSSSMQHR